MEISKKLWKSEYFQTAVTIAIIIIIVLGFWYGSQQALNTQYPALAVASGSMMPTLDIGDLIIVQGTSPEQINADYLKGDVIIYKNLYNPGDLIVHRAVKKEKNTTDGLFYFTTRGDNNQSPDTPFNQTYLVGKVVAKIPYIGNFALFMHTRENFYFFIIVMIILFVVLSVIPFSGRTSNEAFAKRKMFGRIDPDFLYSAVLNLLLIGFILFNIWGAYTFWQQGAKSAQYVTARGIYADLAYYQSYGNANSKPYNHVFEALLSHGIMTYSVDCNVTDGTHSGIRPGVLTLSIAQVGAVALIVFDAWTAVKFLRARKAEAKAVENTRHELSKTSEAQST